MTGTGQEDNTQQQAGADTSTPDTAPQQDQSVEDAATPFDKFVEDTSRPTAPAQQQAPVEPQQPQAPQQAATGLPHERGLRRTNTGDLVNADGQLVARAGTESRHWQRANDAAREIQSMRGELDQLRTANEAFRSAATSFSTLGLQPNEMAAAANLMANWKQNPASVIKYLLTEAQAAGHDLSAILGGAQAGVDPAAIRRIVQEAVAPLTSAQQEQHRVAQAHDNAAREYQDFAQQYPEALVQEEEIASLMRRFPDMSAEAAHLRLHNYALQNGFDYTQPLRPQFEARRSGMQVLNTPSQPQPANRSVLPGSRMPASNGMTDMRTAAAPASTSTRDIVAEALREAGIQLQ
jgi:hypothetical protein